MPIVEKTNNLLNKENEIMAEKVKNTGVTKESGYFSKFSIGRVTTEQEYKNLYSNSENNQLIGESTAIYLRDPETPDLIYKANPKAKIIILLRDPIERAHSHYLKYIRNGYETEPFSRKIAVYKKNNT